LVDAILRAVDSGSYWSGHIVSFAVLAATVAIVAEIVMRHGLGSPTRWGFEAPLYFAAATYFLGGAYAQIDDSHVRMDLLYSRWSPRTRAWVNLLVTWPVMLVGLGILAYASLDWTIAAYQRGLTSGSRWDPPIWPVRGLIPLSSSLLLLQGLASVVRDVRMIRYRQAAPDES
jgi:TRAP-type mannitol/chloroaromatic compound transport system permease small subunit